MGKCDGLKYLKLTKARVKHICSKCGKEIEAGNYYYAETINDRFLQSLHSKKFCLLCFEKFGESLIK